MSEIGSKETRSEDSERASIDTPVVSPKDGATMNDPEDQDDEAMPGISEVSGSNEAEASKGGADDEDEEDDEGAVKVKEEKDDDDEDGEGSTRIKQEKLDQLLNEYEKEAGNIDAAIKKEMQKSQQARQNQSMPKKIRKNASA